MDVTRAKPSPLTGMELLEILFKTGFFADKESGIALMNDIADACEAMTARGEGSYTASTFRESPGMNGSGCLSYGGERSPHGFTL